jgi:two-component system response regulator HydG
VLRRKGYKVIEANNGAQAVQIVRDEPVDMVILDVRMPMMTGYEAAKWISRESPQTPIIFLSAKGMQHEVRMGYESGKNVVDYLVKPISTEELVKQVDGILEVSRAEGIEQLRKESLERRELVELVR